MEKLNVTGALAGDLRLSRGAVVVGVHLIRYINAQWGYGCPSASRLAGDTHLSKAAVLNAIKRLVETGWIEIAQMGRGTAPTRYVEGRAARAVLTGSGESGHFEVSASESRGHSEVSASKPRGQSEVSSRGQSEVSANAARGQSEVSHNSKSPRRPVTKVKGLRKETDAPIGARALEGRGAPGALVPDQFDDPFDFRRKR